MPSKYAIGPSAAERNIFPKLAGIGELIGRGREKKEQEKAKAEQDRLLEEAREKAQEAYESGDPMQIAEIMFEYPHLREAMESAMGIGGEMRERQIGEERTFYESVLADPGRATRIINERIAILRQGGRDASQSVELFEEFQTNPEQALKSVEMMYAGAVGPEEFKKYQDAIGEAPDESTAALQTLEGRAKAAGMTSGTPEYQEFMRYGGARPTGGEADQRDRMIADYRRLFNLSEEDATMAVDARPMMDDRGNLITYQPVTGGGNLVDVDTGAEQDIIDAPAGTALEDLAFDPGAGTGFGASFVGFWNSTLGQIPFVPVGKTAEEAAQNLRILERDAIAALATSGRPPLVEQERIMAILPQGMDWFENPEIAQYKTTNFVDLMMNQYVDDLRYSEDRSNPREVRETSTGRARRIESIVRRVLTPDAADVMFNSLSRIETEIGELRSMEFDELLTLDTGQLTDNQLDIYIERLDSGR